MKVKELIELLTLTDESGEMEVVLVDIQDDTETGTKNIASVEMLFADKVDAKTQKEVPVIAITF